MIGRNSIRVVLVHNFYRQPGGEDRVFATEAQVLRERGHQVFTYSRRNPKEGGAAVLRLCGQAFWNQSAYLDLRSLIRNVRPDVVHLHNTFPLLSPAVCYAARREGIAVVQTLHNYRLLCPNGLFFRDGRPCEDCIDRPVPWPAVLHACYRNSYAASLVAGGTLAAHRALGTWATQVDRYIALTEFARQKFIAGGLTADSIVLKPNVVQPDPGLGSGDGRFALFVGRLSHEKGIDILLAAWRRVAARPTADHRRRRPAPGTCAPRCIREPGHFMVGAEESRRGSGTPRKSDLLDRSVALVPDVRPRCGRGVREGHASGGVQARSSGGARRAWAHRIAFRTRQS